MFNANAMPLCQFLEFDLHDAIPFLSFFTLIIQLFSPHLEHRNVTHIGSHSHLTHLSEWQTCNQVMSHWQLLSWISYTRSMLKHMISCNKVHWQLFWWLALFAGVNYLLYSYSTKIDDEFSRLFILISVLKVARICMRFNLCHAVHWKCSWWRACWKRGSYASCKLAVW